MSEEQSAALMHGVVRVARAMKKGMLWYHWQGCSFWRHRLASGC